MVLRKEHFIEDHFGRYFSLYFHDLSMLILFMFEGMVCAMCCYFNCKLKWINVVICLCGDVLMD
jgi:hypothetical protein